MGNKLTTIMYKLDYDYIFKNFLKKELWEKEWCLFEHDDLKIIAKLSNIDIERKKVSMKIYMEDNYWTYSFAYFYYDEAHYNQKCFQNSINDSVISVIKEYENFKIYKTDEYKNAEIAESEQRDELRSLAEDFLDNNGISNDVVRDAYIDAFISENQRYLTLDVIREYRFKKTTNMYVLYASYINDDELFEKYRPYLDESTNFEEIMEEIEQVKNDIEEGYYRDMDMPDL